AGTFLFVRRISSTRRLCQTANSCCGATLIANCERLNQSRHIARAMQNTHAGNRIGARLVIDYIVLVDEAAKELTIRIEYFSQQWVFAQQTKGLSQFFEQAASGAFIELTDIKPNVVHIGFGLSSQCVGQTLRHWPRSRRRRSIPRCLMPSKNAFSSSSL